MFRRLDTGIETLNDLLIPEHRGKVSRDGIAFHNHVGFFGVIFGAAGSGKSVLSLHLCCRFAELGTRKKEHHAVYVTQEPFQLVKDKIVDHFGFLPQGTIYPEHEIPRIWNDKGNSTLTIVRMPLDPKRQKAKLEYILRMVKERFCVGRDPVAESQLLFCLDNAEAIALCAYPKEIREYAIPTDDDLPTNKQDHPERPKDELFFKRLRSYCAEHCLNAWFTFEEDRTQSMFTEELSIATTQEAYAADIVIRLGIRVFDNGYRERSLEIVKAKNQAHRRGRHHFTIQSKNSDSPGGIVIFPSIAAQLYVIGRRDLPESQTLVKSSTPAHKPCLLGIKEVDEEINLQRLGVSERAKLRILGNVVSVGYLNSDTVSVLVSDLDSIASEIAIQFALQNDQTTLYLSTLHSKSVIEDMLEKYLTLKKSKGRAKLHFRELQPEHISEGKLLKDIDRWIGNGKRSVGSSKCERVVIDNVFGLSKKFPLIHDERQFLAALFALLRYKAVPSLVVDMVDVGEGQNPLHESFAAGLADHVFILRHAELRSGVSKIFSVGKLAGIHKPDKLWELQETPERIVAEDRLAFFKGALSGKPEPVEVKLSVFGESENSPLHNYLKTECEELKATFGQNINVHACLADTYGAMQQSVEARNLSALGDCHVISIDEIWLGELIQRGLLQEFQIEFIDQDDPEKRLWNYQEYVTAAQDIAFYQERQRIRKKIRGERDPAKRAELRSRQGELRISDCNFAIPARVNVGVLTYNPNVYEMDSVKLCFTALAAATSRT